MKVLVINGSHRKGNTNRFVKELEIFLSEEGHSVKRLDLLENRFAICDGCLACEETGQCVINDGFTDVIVPELLESDAYVFAMPVYFNTVPALFKSFIDRTNSLCAYYEENPKKVAIFLVGQLDESEGSFSSALAYLREYAEIMNFELCGDSVCVTAREPNDLIVTNEIKKKVLTWF